MDPRITPIADGSVLLSRADADALLLAESAVQTLTAERTELLRRLRKHNPGHYISVGNPWPAVQASVLRTGVRGVQLRYPWRDLEPAKGQYDFARMEADLRVLDINRAQLVAMIEDKSFTDAPALPGYLADRSRPNKNGGHTAVRWDPYVQERMRALVQAVGQAFDTAPNFEGVAFQETSVGFSTTQLTETGYTPEGYRDALIGQLLAADAALPTSRVFWYMNFFPTPTTDFHLRSVAEAVRGRGVLMGGPDILPDSDALNTRAYPLYSAVDIETFCSMQFDSYRHMRAGTTRYWTMAELLEWARARLRISYCFWNYTPTANPAGSNDIADAYAVIAASP